MKEILTPADLREIVHTIAFFRRRNLSWRETDIAMFLSTGVTLRCAERLISHDLMRIETAQKLRLFWSKHQTELQQARRWDSVIYSAEALPLSEPIEVKRHPLGLLEEWHRYAVNKKQTIIVTLEVVSGIVHTVAEALWITLPPQPMYISPKR